jgi:hypothetical protein
MVLQAAFKPVKPPARNACQLLDSGCLRGSFAVKNRRNALCRIETITGDV